MSELKPCPFCGTSDIDLNDGDSYEGDWNVVCLTCSATVYGRTVDEIRSAWNRRADKHDELRELVKELADNLHYWSTMGTLLDVITGDEREPCALREDFEKAQSLCQRAEELAKP